MNSGLHRLAVIAAIIAFCVIVLGAYVRLSHAGLGCPDWPGCYGQISWPVEVQEVQDANLVFPDRPVESEKAWKEMVHRYLAGAPGTFGSGDQLACVEIEKQAIRVPFAYWFSARNNPVPGSPGHVDGYAQIITYCCHGTFTGRFGDVQYFALVGL